MAQSYPDKNATASELRRFSPKQNLRWSSDKEEETRRIRAIKEPEMLEIELSEAAGKWSFSHDVVTGEAESPYISKEEARYNMVLANHRYWTALERLNSLSGIKRWRDSVTFWVIVVGGFIASIIAAIAGILALE